MAAMRAGDLDTAERAFTECLELARGLGEQLYVAAALVRLGEIALSRDLPEVAATALSRRCLSTRARRRARRAPSACTRSAAWRQPEGRTLDAARLWGAADVLRERSGRGAEPEEKAVDVRFRRSRRACRGGRGARRGRAEGRLLGNDELDALVGSLKESRSRLVSPPTGESRKEPVMGYEGEGVGRVKVSRTSRASRRRASTMRSGSRACLRCPDGTTLVVTRIEVVTKDDPNVGSYKVTVAGG
jgi:hypothetical protein